MKILAKKLAVIRQNLPYLRASYGVAEIGVFGSVARGEENLNSDLDVLVSFTKTPGFIKFIQLEGYLQKIVGMKVDLVTPAALKPLLKNEILRDVTYV